VVAAMVVDSRKYNSSCNAKLILEASIKRVRDTTLLPAALRVGYA
jgi:hypothetical protein